MNVSYRSPIASELFWSQTVENAYNNVDANSQERLGKFELERTNAMERIEERVHGTVTFTLKKRKKYCVII